MQIAVLVDHLGRSLWILIIALHHIKALAAHLTLHANGAFLAGFGVEHLHIYKWEIASHSSTTLLKSVVQAGLRHTRRALGQSVHAGNRHIHLFRYLLHQLDRTERSGHDTCTQATQVEHREHRVIQLGYEHRRHTVNGGTTLFVYRGQHYQWVELLNHHLGTAVSQAVHRGQHHTKAVEQGHAYTQFIILCKAHILAGKVTIVRNAVVRQHHTLGETCGTAGVLHVAHIVAAHLLLHRVQCLVIDILTQQQQLGGVIHTAILLHTYIYYVLKVRESLAVQMSALASLQLWQHGVGHIHIVTIPCTIGNAQHFHIRVLTQILQLVLLVVGVHRYQHGTNLSSSIQEGEPVGHISSPDTHIRALLNADRYQALGQIIHTLVKLAPGKAQVSIRIYYVFLIRSSLSPVLQPFTQSSFPQLVSLRASLGWISSIRQRSARHIVFYITHLNP